MNLIGYAPKNTKVDKSLEYSKVKTLDFKEYPWLELPSGLANLTNLTSLDLSSCRSLQNIDGLGNLAKLTSLDLSGCYFLKNIDGLANLPNLSSLNLEYSNEVQPKPSKEVMTTREEVAAYQEEIKKSMK